MRTTLSPFLAIACAAVLAACGGKGNPTAPSQPEPTLLTVNDTAPGIGFFEQDVIVQRSGTLAAVLTWATGSKDLDLYLTTDRCAVLGPNCTILGSSEAVGTIREELIASVSAGQTYKVWIINRAFTAEPFNLRMVFQ